VKKILVMSITLLLFSTQLCLGSEKDDKIIDKPKNGDQPIWKVIKSPLTGKCYEIMYFSKDDGNYYNVHQGYGFMGMSEISCDYLKSK